MANAQIPGQSVSDSAALGIDEVGGPCPGGSPRSIAPSGSKPCPRLRPSDHPARG